MATQTQDWEDIESIDDIDDVDDTDKSNDRMLVYKSASGNMEYEDKPSGGGHDWAPACWTATNGTTITTTAKSVALDTAVVSDTNYSISTSIITVTAAGTYHLSFSCPIEQTDSGGSTRTRVNVWVIYDSGGGYNNVSQSYSGDYFRDASGGCGVSGQFVMDIAAGGKIILRINKSNATPAIKNTDGESQLSIFRVA